jgi:hypothetical protein
MRMNIVSHFPAGAQAYAKQECLMPSMVLAGDQTLPVGIGEPGWDRTIDPLIKSQMLYR